MRSRSNIWLLHDIGPNGDDDSSQQLPPTIVLASQSPNRLALLRNIGIDPLVVVSDFDENLPETLPPPKYVEETAAGKALAVAKRMVEEQKHFDVVIGCDTVIVVDGKIIGKAKDAGDALATLKGLNNRWHDCYTGVVLVKRGGEQPAAKFNVRTEIKFGDFPDSVYESYVRTGECFGCAGSYKIQYRAAAFVEQIRGCHSNIVGIPVYEVVKHLRLLLKK